MSRHGIEYTWLYGASFEVGPAEFHEYLKAAREGDASAQENVGNFYAIGQCVAQDYGEAFKWWRKAAEQDVVHARYMIGNCYSNGWGVPQSEREAVTHWHQAAAKGHASAQYNLGFSYIYGEGVSPDTAKAYLWFESAVAGYQDIIDSGVDMRKYKRDAIWAAWRDRWLRRLERCLDFLGSVGLLKFKPIHRAALTGDTDLTVKS